MKSIAVFNNKGGVGKTTLLCNLASYLSNYLSKRVLIVDADPQCNASIYTINIDELEGYIFSEGTTIRSVFEPVQSGEGFIEASRIPFHFSSGFNVHVIVGDPKLSLLEDFLSKDWYDGTNGEPRGLKTTFTFFDLLQKISSDFDYVFFDVGPSLGAINRSVLLSCDFFLIPMSTDIFSLQAITNIAQSVKSWKDSCERGMNEYCAKNGRVLTINDKPISIRTSFIGYITQQYVAKSVSGVVRPVKAYEQIIRQIPDVIKTQLLGMYPESIVETLSLGTIPNFNSLIPLSQTVNKPIFKLSGPDGVVGAHFAKVKDYEEVVRGISMSLLQNIQNYD